MFYVDVNAVVLFHFVLMEQTVTLHFAVEVETVIFLESPFKLQFLPISLVYHLSFARSVTVYNATCCSELFRLLLLLLFETRAAGTFNYMNWRQFLQEVYLACHT